MVSGRPDDTSHRDANNLIREAYSDLRRIAAAQMLRVPPGATLQPTALVHEAWLRMGASTSKMWDSREHFLAAAAETMRHILIDRARSRRAIRHGGGLERVDIDGLDVPAIELNLEGLIALGAAVDRMASERPDLAALVKLRCFGGLEVSEAASVLGIPRATAFRRWTYAQTWLFKELEMPRKRQGTETEQV